MPWQDVAAIIRAMRHADWVHLQAQAARTAPAIIFLDELDALVPARSVRGGGTDQVYASVVSTLLALMDGVTDRGSVIVIGATNRRGRMGGSAFLNRTCCCCAALHASPGWPVRPNRWVMVLLWQA